MIIVDVSSTVHQISEQLFPLVYAVMFQGTAIVRISVAAPRQVRPESIIVGITASSRGESRTRWPSDSEYYVIIGTPVAIILQYQE